MKAKRSFNALFWPVLIELMFFVIMGTADTIMLSRYSDHAVGSVGNANTIIQLFAVPLLIVSGGVAVLVSQYLGAKRNDMAKGVIGTGLILNLIIGFVIAITLFMMAPLVLKMVGTSAVLYDDALTYLRIIGLSLFVVALNSVMSASLRSHGFAKVITFVVIGGNLINVMGNYVLIYGHLGFPSLGVFGAAISTFFARLLMLSVFFMLGFILMKVRAKDLRLPSLRVKQIFHIGIPSAAEGWVYTIMQGAILVMINALGPDFITIKTYVNMILTYIIIFSLSFASANAVITGYHIGERRYDVAYRQTLRTVLRSFGVILTATLAVNLFSKQLLMLFTTNPFIIDLARRILWLGLLLEFARTINMTLIQALKAAGDTSFPLGAALVSMLLITIPAAYVFSFTFSLGIFGIYLAYVLDEFLRAGMMLARWQSKKWESKSAYLEKSA